MTSGSDTQVELLCETTREVVANEQEEKTRTTSRPQHLAQPAAKCGKPAASDGTGFEGSILALLTKPYC